MSEARSRETPWEENAHVRVSIIHEVMEHEARQRVSHPIRRSGLGRHETPGPPVKSRGAQTPRGTHAVKAAAVKAGNARGTGARSSHGWQKSIGRIARLGCREIARSRGGEFKTGR